METNCSFCGKGKEDVEIMIQSPDKKFNICSDCVEMSKTMLKEYGPSKRKIINLGKPKGKS